MLLLQGGNNIGGGSSSSVLMKNHNNHDLYLSLGVGVASVISLFLLQQQQQSRRQRTKLPEGVEYPPHRFSFLPYLGKALESSSMHVRDFIYKYSYDNQDPMFTCTIAGDKCLFIADPDLIALIYKDRPELDFSHLGEKFQIGVMGLSRDDLMKRRLDTEQNTSPSHSTNLMHKHFLKRESLSDRIHVAQEVLIQHIDELIITNNTSSNTSNTSSSWSSMGLYELTRQLIFKATMASIVGHYMTKEEHLEDFMLFDEKFPFLFSNAPKFLTSKAREARERLVDAFKSKDYTESDQTPFIKDKMKELNPEGKKGLTTNKDGDDNDSNITVSFDYQIRQYMSFMWVSVANSMPAVFWTLYYLLRDQEAYSKCLEQVQSVIGKRDKNTKNLWFTLDELDEMTILNSIFLETLRLKQVIYSARLVTDDFVYNPKSERKFMVEKGTKILACPTLVHYDPKIFDNPHEFQYNRFQDVTMKKNGKLLTSYVRAFGGGGHLCSGRKFITYETQEMLAMMITRLDLRLIDYDIIINNKDSNNDDEIGIQYSRQGIGVPPPTRDPILEYRKRQM